MRRKGAVAWVDRHSHLVRMKSMDFMANSPYDMEDFLHDAYEAALRTVRVSRRKGISFSSVFWRTFRRHALRIAPSACMKRSNGVSMSAFDCQQYSDEVYYGGDGYLRDPEDIILNGRYSGEAEEKALLCLHERLTSLEKRVLVCICGMEGGRMSQSETAHFLGMTVGAVHQTCRRIMKRAAGLHNNHVLDGFRRGET